MNSQSLSRLLQGTYQGLGSQYGIVDLRPPVLSPLETNSSPSRTNRSSYLDRTGAAARLSTPPQIWVIALLHCAQSCTAVTTYVVYFVPRREVQRCFGMIVSVQDCA